MDRRLAVLAPLLLVAIALVPSAGADQSLSANPSPITINDTPRTQDVGLATPYPSTIAVSGVPGTVTKVTVSLTGVSHVYAAEIDMLLVGPHGQAMIPMSDAGFAGNVDNATLVFDDAAGAPLPTQGQIVSGTYKPTNYSSVTLHGCGVDPDVFPAPAPAPSPPYGDALSVFNGIDPNGTWSLYVVDDCATNATGGMITGGWSLAITTLVPARVAAFSARAHAHHLVLIAWRTSSETGLSGFNVLRKHGRRIVRLNRTLIAALKPEGSGGATYHLLDKSVIPGASYTYSLELVRRDGTKSSFGAASVKPKQ